MINANGETIYTNAEIAYELGLAPTTVNACARRLYGKRTPHYTLSEAKRICEYIRSISVEEDSRRLALLHETIAEVMRGARPIQDEEMQRHFDDNPSDTAAAEKRCAG